MALNKAGVKLNAGNDRVDLSNLRVASDLIVETADGADRVNLIGDTAGDKIAVETGAGDDTVRGTDVTVTGDLDVEGEDGAGTVNFTRATGRTPSRRPGWPWGRRTSSGWSAGRPGTTT